MLILNEKQVKAGNTMVKCIQTQKEPKGPIKTCWETKNCTGNLCLFQKSSDSTTSDMERELKFDHSAVASTFFVKKHQIYGSLKGRWLHVLLINCGDTSWVVVSGHYRVYLHVFSVAEGAASFSDLPSAKPRIWWRTQRLLVCTCSAEAAAALIAHGAVTALPGPQTTTAAATATSQWRRK